MKNKSIISLLIFLSGFGVSTTSCEDMLTPEVDLYAEGFTGKDTVNFYLGILANVQEVIENNVILGELRGDLVAPTAYVSDSVSDVLNFTPKEDADNGLLNRAAYYKVINQCNFYMAKVDTMAQKNNNYYMRREFAQVQMIRAWTYMQLVQNYGRVPFITKPVDNANTGWETNPENGLWATADNLLDLLKADGLDRAYAYERELGMPDYGTFSTGAVSVLHKIMTFPGDIVLGDLHLLRSNREDYEMAAQYYYNYLDRVGRENNFIFEGHNCSISKNSTAGGATTSYYLSATNWGSWIVGNYDAYSTNITAVPSAANGANGKVLTRIQQIYGFDAKSRSYVNEGEEETTTTGQVTLKANYRNRQVIYSDKYQRLNRVQPSYLAIYESSGDNRKLLSLEYTGAGDVRYYGNVAERVATESMEVPFIQKMSFMMGSNSSMHSENTFTYPYVIPVYRMAQVRLRFAEAINRAGFPRHAFAVLKGGLSNDEMPVISDSLAYNADSTQAQTVLYTQNVENGTNWIDIDELRRAQEKPYLDFSETHWSPVGVHSVGNGGFIWDKDTLYSYDVLVKQRIADEAARSSLSPDEPTDPDQPASAKRRGTVVDGVEILPPDDPKVPEDLAAQINAMETLIADEMALETSYEGFRFYDLYRIARHKNNDNYNFLTADYGTRWFAWTIARRNIQLNPYEQPEKVDDALFSRLLNPQNWYLRNPEY